MRVENRYKGFRVPHKIKSAVSGCIRECAEAASKDFGMIATETGYNLYFGGNGGAQPVHGVLFATDLDEATVLTYIDRYLMYYALTGERLERTARWQERVCGEDPVEHLTGVIIQDKLGIVGDLDRRMQHIVDSYEDEWARAVKDPLLTKKFKQFANTDKTYARDELIEFVEERGQRRPADWQPDGAPQTLWRPHLPDAVHDASDVFARSEKSWVEVGSADDFAPNVGTTVRNDAQVDLTLAFLTHTLVLAAAADFLCTGG